MKKLEYEDSDFHELEAALLRSDSICNGRPDQFQYFQNELTKEIAFFLLKPYRLSKMKSKKLNEKQ